MTALWLVPAAIAVILLVRVLVKRMASNRIRVFTERRRASSLLATRGELVDGNRHMDVALSLTDSLLIYENPDFEGKLDRTTIHEVEYENELATGQPVYDGKVMRLRCFSKTFEFVIPANHMREWQTVMPAHRAAAV
jgi:hypothetical protein